MKKILFNAFWFIPVILFGCFDGAFTGKPDKVFIQDVAHTKLDNRSLTILNKYGTTIKKYADSYNIDWRLVIAVMKVESQFQHSAESSVGARGFMQIMPATQQEVADKLGIDNENLEDPHGNIRGGIFYLSRLYQSFDGNTMTGDNRIELTLAAYNAGLARVQDAQKMAQYVNDNPNEWSSVKNSFSLLSKKYSSLHKYVWAEKKPTSGYFKGWKQTSNYVESVMAYYRDYQKAFPDKV
jgi:membrane-bound lytic murein transglycosylase F